MPKNCIKFISGFLIPSLNNKKFGNLLKWVDESKNIFQIEWCHKGGPKWTEEEAKVFVEWDKYKGHFQPYDKLYFTKSKQRFRSLLYKLTLDGQLKKMKSNDKYVKVYCIGETKRKRRKRISGDTDAECELSDEDGILSSSSSLEEKDYECSDDMRRRKNFDDSTKNVLEDHTYSNTSNLQNNYTDTNEAQLLQANFQAILIPTSLPESPDYLDKRVLVEKNDGCEYLNIPASSAVPEILMEYDVMKNVNENMIASWISGKLQEDPILASVHENKSSAEYRNYLDFDLSTFLNVHNFDFSDSLRYNNNDV